MPREKQQRLVKPVFPGQPAVLDRQAPVLRPIFRHGRHQWLSQQRAIVDGGGQAGGRRDQQPRVRSPFDQRLHLNVARRFHQ